MCGLVALLDPGRTLTVGDLVRLNCALTHRGPDDEGYLVDDGRRAARLEGRDTPAPVRATLTESQPQGSAEELAGQRLHVGLGHRRLSIVDLSPHGHQPMVRGSLAIVFNGEIYDHVEVREELRRLGHRFTSLSDTEVLLAAYMHWRGEAFSRINGMWSCVIYDMTRRMLVVARDRYGVKPLYWWQGAGGELAFASEIKALLRHPRVSARTDETACARWIGEGPQAWRSETLFARVFSFPAGHWAEVPIDAPRPLLPLRYWHAPLLDVEQLAAPYDNAQAERYSDEYRSLLESAVRIRMRMDVRFGTALSGGLDSSQIASFVNAELRRRGATDKQEVFSSVYRGETGVDRSTNSPLYHARLRTADESSFIASVARELDVRSNSIEPDWRHVPSEHERMIWALDLPPTNTLMSSWHTYALVARRGVVVTLDGQGADEQLAGYVYYVANLLAHTGTAAAAREAAALLRHGNGMGPMVAAGLAGHLVRRLAGGAGLEALVHRLGRGRGLLAPLGDALRNDFDTHLQTLLLYADKSAMAWSVESRMPFMDWRLVNFLCRLPLVYRIHAGWTKWIARHAMRTALPASVVWRRAKLGWAIPEEAWFGGSGPLESWLAERLEASDFARSVASSAGIDAGNAGLATRLRLLNLAVWHRLFFEEPGRPGRPLGRDVPLGTS